MCVYLAGQVKQKMLSSCIVGNVVFHIYAVLPMVHFFLCDTHKCSKFMHVPGLIPEVPLYFDIK